MHGTTHATSLTVSEMPIFVAWTLLTHATNIFIHAKNPDSSSEWTAQINSIQAKLNPAAVEAQPENPKLRMSISAQ